MPILVTDKQFSGVSSDVTTLAMPLLQKHGLQCKEKKRLNCSKVEIVKFEVIFSV